MWRRNATALKASRFLKCHYMRAPGGDETMCIRARASIPIIFWFGKRKSELPSVGVSI